MFKLMSHSLLYRMAKWRKPLLEDGSIFPFLILHFDVILKYPYAPAGCLFIVMH